MPPRFRDVRRAFEQFGVQATPPTGGGSHWKLSKDGKTYPIPASHGDKSEIADIYLRKACQLFGIEEAELRKHL